MGDLVPWVERMDELSRYRATELSWPEVWAIVAYGQRNETIAWIQGVLWRLKLWSWVASLDADPATCRCCGRRIEEPHPLQKHCSTACRKVAWRRSQQDRPTDFEELVGNSAVHLREIHKTVRSCQRWLKRNQRLHTTWLTIPPDWTRLDHLPMLPRPCGRCGEGDETCTHTGGTCLYATTGILYVEARDDDR